LQTHEHDTKVVRLCIEAWGIGKAVISVQLEQHKLELHLIELCESKEWSIPSGRCGESKGVDGEGAAMRNREKCTQAVAYLGR
jgi:hypothetical protein